MEKKLFLWRYLLILTLGLSVGLTSCKDDDEPTPEIVTDETVYYIVGEVVSDGKSLEGVKVSASGKEATTGADGLFELELTQKGDYTVSFSKDGYVTVTSKASIASNAKNKASVAIKQALTAKNASVRVAPNVAVDLEDKESGVMLSIPEGALPEGAEISITPYTPGAQEVASGTVSASLMSLNLEPDGLKFEKPVELKLANPMGDAVGFGNMKHIVEKDNTRSDAGEVVYDEESGCYVMTLTGFSNHSFEIAANASAGGSGTESLETKVFDNLGNPAAKNETMTVKQKFGWSMDSDPAASLKSTYPSLPDETINALAGSITSAVSSVMGSAPGTGELSLTMPFNVSGDTKLTVNVLAQTQTQTLSFPLIFADGGLQWFSVTVKKYTGTEIQTTYQYGSTHTDHSGGSGS